MKSPLDRSIAAANSAKLIDASGCYSAVEVLEAILQLFPLDTYDDAAFVMDLVDSDKAKGKSEASIWTEFQKIINKWDTSKSEIRKVERFAFYDRAKTAFAVVATGESAAYANIILKKGVL